MARMPRTSTKPAVKAATAAAAGDDKVDFRTRNAKLKRERMLERLLTATMKVCADTERRGAAVIDDVVREAGVSRGAFYWYFDTLDEAIEMLGRRLADEISAETATLFGSADGTSDPVLAAAVGAQVMLCRGAMDVVWSRFLSNIHFLLDDSLIIKAVKRNLELGRAEGRLHFDSLDMALDFQVGAVLGAIRRCALGQPPSRAAMIEMNMLVLRGLGLDPDAAREIAHAAEKKIVQIAPEKLPWWRDWS